MEQHELEMVVLAILTVADCSVYTLERLSRQAMGYERSLGGALFCTIQRLMKDNHITSYHSQSTNILTYSSTKEGRKYFSSMIVDTEYTNKHVYFAN